MKSRILEVRKQTKDLSSDCNIVKKHDPKEDEIEAAISLIEVRSY